MRVSPFSLKIADKYDMFCSPTARYLVFWRVRGALAESVKRGCREPCPRRTFRQKFARGRVKESSKSFQFLVIPPGSPRTWKCRWAQVPI